MNKDGIKEKVIEEVLFQMKGDGVYKGEQTCKGRAYIDWGSCGNIYKNCPNMEVAEEVAQMFKDRGYYVYYHLRANMGIPDRPACIRIYTEPQDTNPFKVAF